MIKENLKPIILGLSFIIGVIIYTEQTKYVLVDSDTEWGGVNYYLLNRTSGEVFHYTFGEDVIETTRITKDGKTTTKDKPTLDKLLEDSK